MPVFINKDTGLAEAIDQPTEVHEVPLIAPDGTPGSAPMDQAGALLQQGYKQPDEAQLSGLLKNAHFNSPLEQAKTLASGVASAATFGASKKAEQLLGAAPEDQVAREEANPGMNAIGEVLGVATSMATGVGEGALLAKAAGATEAAIERQIGSAGLRKLIAKAGAGGVENALFQTGSEVAKFIQQDPAQSAETAIANIGLSGLLGAGAGASLGGLRAGYDGLMDSKATKAVGDMVSRLGEHLGLPKTVNPHADWFDPFKLRATEEAENTIGSRLADNLLKRGLSKISGTGIGYAIGGPMGAVVGSTFNQAIEDALPVVMKSIMAHAPSGAAFTSAVNFLSNAIKGETKLNKAITGLFEGSGVVAAEPGIKDLEKLQQHLDSTAMHPENMINIAGQLDHYMADHAVALGTSGARAASYLQTLKPQQTKLAPMDNPPPVSQVEQGNYNQALVIAQAPLVVVHKIAKGSLTSQDVTHLQKLYPDLYARMSQKMLAGLMADNKMSYKSKQALSMFLGQPLSSSMMTQNIAAAQGTFLGMPAQQPKNGMMNSGAKSMKSQGLSNTPDQARASYRATGHR